MPRPGSLPPTIRALVECAPACADGRPLEDPATLADYLASLGWTVAETSSGGRPRLVLFDDAGKGVAVFCARSDVPGWFHQTARARCKAAYEAGLVLCSYKRAGQRIRADIRSWLSERAWGEPWDTAWGAKGRELDTRADDLADANEACRDVLAWASIAAGLHDTERFERFLLAGFDEMDACKAAARLSRRLRRVTVDARPQRI